jgi:hypothetical protein
MLKLSNKKCSSNNLLHGTAKKSPTWTCRKDIHAIDVDFVISICCCVSDVIWPKYCEASPQRGSGIPWHMDRDSEFKNRIQLRCQFFLSPVLGEWLSTNDAECCVFCLIHVVFFELHLIFTSSFLIYRVFFCFLWLVCLLFPIFLKNLGNATSCTTSCSEE